MTDTAPALGTHRWVSLMARDLPAARRFYQQLFGWQYREGPPGIGPYVQALCGGRQVAGLGETTRGSGCLVAWLPYLATDDADDTAGRVRECGGTVAVGPLDVAGVGRLAIVADVAGAPFGLWQGGPSRRAPLREAGAPVWNELITPATTLVRGFYTSVFGYAAEPEPARPEEVDYLVLRLAGQPVAGIRGVNGALPPDRGPHWLPYFSVTDVDTALRRGEELGGSRLLAPESSPFGRLAWLADPEGAPLGLVQRDR